MTLSLRYHNIIEFNMSNLIPANKPPQAQLQSVKDLIEAGVRLGHIRSDYKLVGHRQVTPTECPGQRS
ncbi:N-acetylmuramoyl-L-alanine amidase, partial [Pseudomonas aeruginosa]